MNQSRFSYSGVLNRWPQSTLHRKSWYRKFAAVRIYLQLLTFHLPFQPDSHKSNPFSEMMHWLISQNTEPTVHKFWINTDLHFLACTWLQKPQEIWKDFIFATEHWITQNLMLGKWKLLMKTLIISYQNTWNLGDISIHCKESKQINKHVPSAQVKAKIWVLKYMYINF